MNSLRDTILIVDDQRVNRVILHGIFEKSYNLIEATNGEEAVRLIEEYHGALAVVLLDIVMPIMDGYEVLKEMGVRGFLKEIPVVVITAENTSDNEVKAFDLGAQDIIVKPFEPLVVNRLVRNVIELNLHRLNQEELIEQQAEKLRQSNAVMIDALSSIIEYRSVETGQHIQRIRLYTQVLLEDVAQRFPDYMLDEHKINLISNASSMHDIGKIGIPDSILNKPGRLTDEEFEIMKQHTIKGCKIMSNLDRISDKEYVQYAYNICRYHHERWDGKGYPDQLAGDNIPICAQVVGVADCFDALTNDRVYKKAIPLDKAYEMITSGECGMFSPKVMVSFSMVRASFEKLAQEYSDTPSSELRETVDRVNQPYSPSTESENSPERNLLKYFTLLRYLNSTVLEADLNTGYFHIIYLSGSNFDSLKIGTTMEAAMTNFIDEAVHEEDKIPLKEFLDDGLKLLFREGMMKVSSKCRIYNLTSQDFVPYQVTLLRTDTEHPEQKRLLLVFETTLGHIAEPDLIKQLDTSIVPNVVKCVQMCRNDKWFTMDDVSDGLASMVGYTKDEIKEKFGNRYSEMIYKEDLKHVENNLMKQTNSNGLIELEYRLVTSSGSLLWVLDKTQYVTSENGREYMLFVLIDISQSKRSQDELSLLMERYQIIMAQTNDIIFEWDAATDKITYSSKSKDKFGYDPICDHASLRLPFTTHIHPDDMEEFTHLIDSVKNGAAYMEADFRLADAEGHYHWRRARVAGQFRGNNTIHTAVGVITDIDKERRTSQELRDRAERDSLTNLYNKKTIQIKIEEYLSHRPKNETSALMIIDVDDFKLINDTYGHMFGDIVLQEFSTKLITMFRSGDMIARVGGDEFIIFMKNVGNREIVTSRAEKINSVFREILTGSMNENKLSCSIGVAFCPHDGTTFKSLYHHSDLALYYSKSHSKDGFAVFDKPSMDREFGKPNMMVNASTRIDSNNTVPIPMESFTDQLLQLLNDATDLDSAIERVLELCGLRFGISRAYIFEQSDDGTTLSNTYEWCADGITPEKELLQNILISEEQNLLSGFFDEEGILYCPDISEMPRRQFELLDSQDIKSMLQCEIRDNGKYKGFVGFDDCKLRRIWTKEQVDTLRSVTSLLSVYLKQQRAQEKAEANTENVMSLLGLKNQWVIVTDRETKQLLYFNSELTEELPGTHRGQACYKALYDLDCPCPDCPLQFIDESGSYAGDKLYPNNKKECIRAYRLTWNEKPANLICGNKGSFLK